MFFKVGVREGLWRETFEQRHRGVKEICEQSGGTLPGGTGGFSVSTREPGGSQQDGEMLSPCAGGSWRYFAGNTWNL